MGHGREAKGVVRAACPCRAVRAAMLHAHAPCTAAGWAALFLHLLACCATWASRCPPSPIAPHLPRPTATWCSSELRSWGIRAALGCPFSVCSSRGASHGLLMAHYSPLPLLTVRLLPLQRPGGRDPALLRAAPGLCVPPAEGQRKLPAGAWGWCTTNNRCCSNSCPQRA